MGREKLVKESSPCADYPSPGYKYMKALVDALGVVKGIPPDGDYTLGTVVYQAAEEITRLRILITNVIAGYDACDGFNNEGRAAELINVTLREAMKEVE